MGQAWSKAYVKVRLISDFSIETLASFLRNGAEPPKCVVDVAPFGEVIGPLLHAANSPHEFAVVWTLAHRSVPTFARALSFETFSEKKVLSEVKEFAGYIKAAAAKFEGLLLVSWTVPAFRRGHGITDLGRGGIRRLLMKMNLALADHLENAMGVYVLDAQRWIEITGKGS